VSGAGQVPWEAASSGAEAREGGYNWEQALSKRARVMEWSPWWAPDMPPPPVPPIMLTGGIPDPESLPIDDLIACNERVLRREGKFALMYGGPQGYPGLREWLANDINRREGLALGEQHFVLTAGSAGAFENLCETLIDPGDVVILENPCFPGTTRIAKSCLPQIEAVPLDDDGLVVDALEQVVARITTADKRPKMLYTISNFQNPAASTMTLERRRAVVDICRRHDILIAQDDAYGAVSFDAGPLPSLFSIAGGTGAVLLGTFSKTLATGLRLGWIMGEQAVIDAVTRMRFDMGVSPWTSRVINEFCESGRYDAHVPRMIEIYRRKRDTMLAALDERCSAFARWSAPKGGFFVWLQLAEAIDPGRLRYTANEEAVGYVGGKAFFTDGGGGNYVRLCYSNVAEHEIPEAIMRFGRALERAVRA
jgi:2-aminoadipate transaminase